MKKRILIITVLIAILLFVVACGSTEDNSKGIFYEVVGGQNELYLFGSVHLGHEDMYPLDASVEKAFSKADVLGLEIDLSSITDMELGQKMIEFGMYNDGTKMTDFVSQETFKRLAELVAPLGIDYNTLDNFNPWFASMLLTEITMGQIGLSVDYGVETYFMDKAEGMEITGLETISDQFAPFTKLSKESQVIYLEQSLKEMDNAEEELNNLLSHWQDGNVEYFAEIRKEMMEDSPTDSFREYQVAMLDGRDEKMARKIAELLEGDNGKTYFIVVGSLHLAGENSIVELLREMGYEVNLGY